MSDDPRCGKNRAEFGGSCCCNCVHLAVDHSHPTTDGKSLMERKGFACLAPSFNDDDGKKMIFSNWGEHGMCEMHEDRISQRKWDRKVNAGVAFIDAIAEAVRGVK